EQGSATTSRRRVPVRAVGRGAARTGPVTVARRRATVTGERIASGQLRHDLARDEVEVVEVVQVEDLEVEARRALLGRGGDLVRDLAHRARGAAAAHPAGL